MTRTERLFVTVGLFWLLAAAMLGFTIAIVGADGVPHFALKFHIHAAILGGILHLWMGLFSERMGGVFPVRAAGFTLLGLTHGTLAAFSAGLLWRYELLAAGPVCLLLALLFYGALCWRAFMHTGGFKPDSGRPRPHSGALMHGTAALLLLGGAAWMALVMWNGGFRFEYKSAHTMLGVFGGLLLAALSVDHFPSPGEPGHILGWQPALELILAVLASVSSAVLSLYGQADHLAVPTLMLGVLSLLHLATLLPRRSSEQFTAWAIGILFLTSTVLLYRYQQTGGDDIRRAAHHGIILGFVLPLLLGHAFGAAGSPGAAAVLSIRALTGGAALLVTGFIVRAAGWTGGDLLLAGAGTCVVIALIFGIKVFFESVETEPPPERGV